MLCKVFCLTQFIKIFPPFSSQCPLFCPLLFPLLSLLSEALSVLQGLTDIHTDANDTTGYEALHSPLSPPSLSPPICFSLSHSCYFFSCSLFLGN